MATEIRVPVQGNDVEDCVLGEIYVGVGDEVRPGQPVFVIETAKAAYDVETGDGGTVLAIVGRSGDEVPVHTTVVVVGDPDEVWQTAGESVAEPAVPITASVVTDSEAADREDPAADREDPAAGRASATSDWTPGATRIAASPKAKALVRRRGLDLGQITGSGPNGRVLASDVLRAGRDQRRSAPPGPPAPAAEQDAAAPLSAVRRVIAERMTESLQQAAQYTLMSVVDARPLQELRRRLKASDPRWGLDSVSITDLVCYAAIRTLGGHPHLNAHFSWDGIRTFDTVHLGLAVETARGLMVPVVADATALRLGELSTALRAAVTNTRDPKPGPATPTASTFTVSSLGADGITYFTPVLNPPEVAILGVGAIAAAAIDTPDGPILAPALHLSLTLDHRAVDGAPGAAFLADLGAALRNLDIVIAV